MSLLETIRTQYGIHPTEIRPIQGGWSAEAFLMQNMERQWLLKIYDTTRPSAQPWIRRMDGYLPLLAWLCRQEEFQGRVPRPIPTMRGDWTVEEAERILLVYAYIPGETIGERALTHPQIDALADLLAALHSIPIDSIPPDIHGLEEDLSLSFCHSLEQQLQHLDQAPLALRDILRPYAPFLRTAAAHTLRLRDAARVHRKTICLCHSDPHNWNLVQGDELALLDWEGACFAPPEADLFWFAGEPFFARLLARYEEKRPGFRLDAEMLLFYRLRRRIEDIEAFIAQWLLENPDEELAHSIAGHLARECQGTHDLLESIPGDTTQIL